MLMMAVNRHGHVQYSLRVHISDALFCSLLGQLFAQAMWSPKRLQGRALSPRAGSQGSYLCAGTNFRNGCLFGTSMLINGRLGRQLSLVLSGIAKGRGAGFFVSGDAIRQHDGRLTATRAA
jgi:hypothetical protein